MKTIFLATTNKGKIKEFPHAFKALDLQYQTPITLNLTDFEVEENGTSFEENALIKARAWATKTGLPALADDAGLSIDVLNGEPGIHSHRFFQGNEKEKNLHILKLLEDIPMEKRGAHYTCVLAFVDPLINKEHVETGYCYGKIAFSPSGDHGFGFDPIFIPEGYPESFGELSDETKLAISHRAKALAAMDSFLTQWVRSLNSLS